MDIIAFIAKKTISAMLQPIGISLILVLGGVVVWKFKHWCTCGPVLIFLGSAFLLVFSFPITSYFLLYGLELQAGPYQNPAALQATGVRHVVVLGGAGNSENLTPADRTGASIFRVLEGVRLCRGIPGSRLILSGMGFPFEANSSDHMSAFPSGLGVPPDALSIYVGAWDTEGEAVYLLKQIGEAQFALVSSAYHMPRAMRQFRDKGLRPIPSPCEFKARAVPHLYKCFVPDASALFDSQLAIHEYLGMLWMTVKRLLS